jgi:hypothetical protein
MDHISKCKAKTRKLLEEIVDENLCVLLLGRALDKLDFLKIKTFPPQKALFFFCNSFIKNKGDILLSHWLCVPLYSELGENKPFKSHIGEENILFLQQRKLH